MSHQMNTSSEDDKRLGRTKDFWLVWCLVGIASRHRHGRFQSVHVGEGLFHHVSGSGSAEEVTRGDTGLYHTPAQLMYSECPL